jgi:hypothetical protein
VSTAKAKAVNEQQRKANRRLGFVLASLAALFAASFVAKMVWLGG